MLYIIYKLGEAISLNAPINVSYAVAKFFADIKFFFSINDRRFVRDNLRVVLGSETKDLGAISKEVFRNFGRYLIEFFRFPKIDKDFVNNKVRFKNLELLEDAVKRKKGVILVSAHIGNWEMGGAVLGLLGYKINVIALNHKDKRINNFFIQRRTSKNMHVIPLGSAIKKSLYVLQNGEILALLGDRDFSKNGIKVDFFGRPAVVPKGPAVLKLKSGCPLILVFVIRDSDGGFTMYFEDPDGLKDEVFSEEAVVRITSSIMKIFEKYIKKYPTQWYVFRKMWS